MFSCRTCDGQHKTSDVLLHRKHASGCSKKNLFGQRGRRYSIILADPPWQYRNQSKTLNGVAKNHYSTMTLEELKQLPVQALAEDDAALLLWATFPTLTDAMAVMESWGFKYKTAPFVWAKRTKNNKPEFGPGFWTRAGAEVCLLGLRGKAKYKTMASGNRSIRQVIESIRREHSRKPEESYERIELLFKPHLKRIELFSREPRPGWAAWGDEVEKFNE